MTAPPAAERSIPARANQAGAGRAAVRASLANRIAPSAGLLHSHLPPPTLGKRTCLPQYGLNFTQGSSGGLVVLLVGTPVPMVLS